MIPSTQPVVQVDIERQYMGQSTMFKENIINLDSFFVKLRLGSGTQAQALRLSDSGSVTLAPTQWQWHWLRAWADTKILEATHHHHPPTTFKHEGGVPHKNPKSKTDLEWSPQHIQHKKFQVDDDREYMGQSNMSKENIINLISYIQYCQSQALSGSLSGSFSYPEPKPNRT